MNIQIELMDMTYRACSLVDTIKLQDIRNELHGQIETLQDTIAELRPKLYEAIYEEGIECKDCIYNNLRYESYPFGDRTISEVVRDCSVTHLQCPAVREMLMG